MDPLSIIMTAIVAGAATAFKPTAEQAVKDAYAGLKRIIQDKYSGQKKVSWGIGSVEEDPDSQGGQALLKEGLSAADAGQDEELLKAAQALQEALQGTPEGKAAVSKYHIVDSEVGIAGDHAKVEGGIHFGSSGK